MENRLAAHDPRHPRSADDPLAELLPRVAKGDETAFRALHLALAPRVFGFALRILRDRAAAEEASIDVFAQVWRQAERYDAAKGCVATWVLTLARTRAIDLARIVERRTRREVAASAERIERFADPLPSPFAASAESERAARIRAELERLPKEQRHAVELAFFSGLSHTEVAAQLRAPLGTVKTRIRTGLTTLRTALASVEGELR